MSAIVVAHEYDAVPHNSRSSKQCGKVSTRKNAPVEASKETRLDAKLEQQLADLVTEVEGKGPGAIYAVLQILQNSYVTGRHNEFAKHCCAFSQVEGASLSAGAPEPTKGPKPPRETLH